MSGGHGVRVSIPTGVRKMILNIREITGSHSDDEIYAMLKECSMDPNETAHKLLLQDTFHEVKRKRDRKKESVNREPVESRWRPGSQGRGGRGGRGNFSARHASHVAGGRNSGHAKENGPQQGEEKHITTLPVSHAKEEREINFLTSPALPLANGPTKIAQKPTVPSESGPESDKLSATVPSVDVYEKPANEGSHEPLNTLPIPASASTVCFSPSDPVLVPSNNTRSPGMVGTIKREVGLNASIQAESKTISASDISSSYTSGKVSSKSQIPSSSSTHPGSSISRPSSNYSSRSSQAIGSLKGGSSKEWKPKAVQGSGTAVTSAIEPTTRSQPVSDVLDSKGETVKLQKKLEELHVRQRQHVILPNHIHVPESERTKLSFGSFGAGFGVSTSTSIAPESEKSSAPPSETSHDVEEAVEEQSSCIQNTLGITDEGEYSEQLESPTHVPENLSSPEGDDAQSNANSGHDEPKQDIGLPSGVHPYSMVQPFDPTHYYAQFYRSGTDNDGRLSPFQSLGVAAKYNGNVTVFPPSQQSLQEGVLSTAGPIPLAAGLMQTSMSVTQQQPLPVFRPPTGMHLSHFPQNYFPYAHYLPPFYMPPPAIHQFMGNGAFPQQPQGAGIYQAQPTVGGAGVKYSIPPYKQGTNTVNPAHMGIATGYGPYGSSPSGYNPGPAAAAGNSTSNEDLGPTQFKENSMYMSGQQSEGSGMWVAAPARDMSSLPTSSFYNMPPQGHHVAFNPAQAAHGTFANMYHPAQAVSAAMVHPLLQQPQTMAGPVDMVGPGGGVYQQPQHTPMNWPSNY